MKKALMLVLAVCMISFTFTPVAHAKKLEEVKAEDVASGVQTFIAEMPENLGKVAYKTIIISAKVIAFPFKQLEKIAN